MKSLLLTFDLESFTLPAELGYNISKDEADRVALEGLKKLAGFLEAGDVQATFFLSLDFSKICQKQVKALIGKGHELALHGFDHSDNYSKMNSGEATKKLCAAKADLENMFGVEVKGFRAPRLQAPKPEVLLKCGFAYDSSSSSTFVPGRYNHFFWPRTVFNNQGIKEVPISVTPVARLPFSWFFFRNLGLGYSKFCTRLALLNTDFVNIYFHNWEFTELNKSHFPKVPKRFLKNTGSTLNKSLLEYVAWCKGKQIESRTISQFLKL